MKTVARRKVNRLFIFYAYGYGTKRIRASGDGGRCTKQRSTPEKENTMAKEKE